MFIYDSKFIKKRQVCFPIILSVLTGIFVFFHVFPVSGQTKDCIDTVAVFSIAGGGDASVNALADETAGTIRRIFDNLGRFMPVDSSLINNAYQNALKNATGGNIYEDAAKAEGADLYITVRVSRFGDFIYSELNIASLDDVYTGLDKKIRLRSRVMGNIPIKACREIVSLHRGLPARAVLTRTYDNNLYLISAGEWQGLRNGGKYITDRGIIGVIQSGRFESIVKLDGEGIENGDPVIIQTYPDTDRIVKKLESRLSKNAVREFGLGNSFLKGGNPENRMVEGMCVNLFGNVCLPGYGAYLSTHYLGFKEGRPDYLSISVSASCILSHFLIPEIMTGFDINPLPVKDEEKTGRMYDLQVFLWAALPVTFSVAYLDQLAFQFKRNRLIPPFFNDKDNMAGVLSLLFPGGGLFYKGLRLSGWGFYFSEISLAGYGIYNFDHNKGIYALYALCALKITDIIYGFFAVPDYDYYNLEKEGEIKRISIEAGFSNENKEGKIFKLLAVLRY